MGSDNQLVELAHRLGWDCTGDEDAVTVNSLAEWVRELEARARHRAERERDAYERSAAMACECPPDDCECAGCMLAAATNGTGSIDRPGGNNGDQ